ncbi:Ig-like domain-containing protein [Paenibacillus sp. GCM10027626]|uniref:Ig-like domain-containing protein n=1 Tax=Paenibacillus sp. GCM10027626 TaxID=3273411 RepID=UPI00363315DB
MHLSKVKTWKKQLAMLLAFVVAIGGVPSVFAPKTAMAADTAPELIVDYEFSDPGNGGLPADNKKGSTLTVVEGVYGGKTYGNTTTEYGTDSAGDYWRWTSDKQRGGGFTLDIDPKGKSIDKSYSVGVRFSYDTLNSSWTKIIDYKDKTKDQGFYFDSDKKLKFFDVGTSGKTSVQPKQIIDIIATRDATTKMFTAYMIVDGEFLKEIEVDDSSNGATPIVVNNKIRFGFFHDDYISGGDEKTTGGKVYSIKFWDGAITPAEVLKATAAKGTEVGTTTVSVTPASGSNSYKVLVSDKLLPFPLQGEQVPAGASDYNLGDDIPDVDANTNKYVGIYEVDENGNIISFKQITLTNDDIKMPTLEIEKPADTKVFENKPEFTGKTEAGVQVTAKIKNKNGEIIDEPQVNVNDDGTWSFLPGSELPDGDYTIEVTADKNGNSVTQTKDITVDATLPKLEIDKPSGNKVYVPNPEFGGKADPEAKVTVTLKDQDGKVIETKEVPVKEDGTWNFTPENDLKDGAYTVEVTAEKGGKSRTETKDVTVDTTVPALEINEPSGNTVTVAKPEFKGKTTPGATVTVEIKDKDGKVVGKPEVTVNSDGTWSFSPDIDLPDGEYSIEVTATKDGKSTKEKKNVTVDTKLPSLVSLTPSSGSLSPAFDPAKGSYTMTVTNSVYELKFTPVAVDPGSKIEIKVNDGSFAMVASGSESGALPLNVGDNKVIVKVTDRYGKVKEYVVTVTRENANTDGGNWWIPAPGPGPSTTANIITSVDGANNNFATGTTKKDGDNEVTTVQVDTGKLNEILADGKSHQLSIRVPGQGEVEVKGLTAADVKKLVDTGSTLTIEDELLAIYPVPAQQLDLDAIAKQWNGAELKDIALDITIKNASQELADSARNEAAAKGYELLVHPVDLDLTFSKDGKTVRAGQLDKYAVKYIALPKDIDPNRITTGVVVNPDGTTFHLPTVVTKINDRYFAQINDLRSAGTYSVIWNPQDFNDVKKHWAQSNVNNIAARLQLKGTGNNTYSPNRNVNRSEFASIVTLGMGFMRQEVPQNMFSDVSQAHWYHNAVTIANEFGIVLGYSDGLFRGEQEITREQGIAMIARAYRFAAIPKAMSQAEIAATLASFGDADKVSNWAKESVAQMVAAGVIEGKGANLLNPQASMTRSEATAMMERLLKTTNLID